MAFYADKKKEGKLVLTSLPTLYRKCNADLDYESVTDAPNWIVKVPSLLIRYTSMEMLASGPQNSHSVLPERIST
jgi:hypothetical protein